MSLFLRVYQHLLPDSVAWRLTITKTLRKFFDGLTGLPQDVRAYADAQIWGNVFPSSCDLNALAEWEREFGLTPDPVEATRRLNLAAAWAAGGGQSPGYLQAVLQTAGFNVYVHEWWASTGPFVARDPRTYTQVPLIGTYQCRPNGMTHQPQCSAFSTQPRCNVFLANDPGYLVNKDLSLRPPPIVPSDPTTWPFFIYISAASFPTHASVPASRRAELERLILKLRPTQQWVVMLIDYYSGIFDFSYDATFG